jgi:hypothetical protein
MNKRPYSLLQENDDDDNNNNNIINSRRWRFLSIPVVAVLVSKCCKEKDSSVF